MWFPDDQIGEDEQGEGIVLGGVTQYPWEGTDRDYKYDEVIDTSFLLKFHYPVAIVCGQMIDHELYEQINRKDHELFP
jgi:hypothetical protein